MHVYASTYVYTVDVYIRTSDVMYVSTYDIGTLYVPDSESVVNISSIRQLTGGDSYN